MKRCHSHFLKNRTLNPSLHPRLSGEQWHDTCGDIVVHHDDAREPAPSMYRRHWWLIIVVILSALFLIGLGVIGDIRIMSIKGAQKEIMIEATNIHSLVESVKHYIMPIRGIGPSTMDKGEQFFRQNGTGKNGHDKTFKGESYECERHHDAASANLHAPRQSRHGGDANVGKRLRCLAGEES